MSKFRISIAVTAVAAALVSVGPSAAFASMATQRPQVRTAATVTPQIVSYVRIPLKLKAVTPAAYPPLPSYCTFSGLILRDLGSTVISADGLVSCSRDMTTISITLDIQRKRWYGWEQLRSGGEEDHNTDALLTWLSYDCAGTGTHDFRSIVGAEVFDGQTIYVAKDLYYYLRNQTC